MTEERIKKCDACGTAILSSKTNDPTKAETKPIGGFSASFSAYFYGMEWERGVPNDFDACSGPCAAKLLRVALSHVDPDHKR